MKIPALFSRGREEGPIPERRPTRRVGRRSALAAATVVAVSLGGLAAVQPAESASAINIFKPRTVVSLTFDDGNADLKTAATIMAQSRMAGTFYINSGFIGAPGYFTVDDLKALSAAGNEIGGHSVTHPDLPAISADEAKRQVCNDRATLTSWGFKVTSFAYPFADADATTEAVVKACGYNSGRGLGDLKTRFSCSGCAVAESFTPADKYYTKAPDQVDATWTLQDLQNSVTAAEAKGGWVQFTFHHVCDNACDALAVTPALLTQFTKWLATRSILGNTLVKPVNQVITGAVAPVVTGPVVAPAGPGVNGIQNPSLETANAATGQPQCWMVGGYGTNTATFAPGTPARTGSYAENVTVSGYSSGDAKLLPTFDLGACSPTVTPAHTYSLRTWYTASTVTQYAVYLRDNLGVWRYWTSSPWFAASDTYTQAVWTTPAIPAGMTALSFGLSVFSNGTALTDDYEMFDTVGAPAPAAPAAATPAQAPAVTGRVEVQTGAITSE